MSRRGQIVRRAGQEKRLEIMKLIQQAARSTATWRVWDDFVYMSAAAISQPFRWIQAREDEYMRRINSYDKAAQALFPQMFAALVEAFEQEGCNDILGGMYMELELGNHWTGQFFTPDSVCQAMAKISVGSVESITKKIETKGYISVNDPSCGGGATLIAMADLCKQQNINYQNSILFAGQDVDPVVARMCYVQMSLLGMPGHVIIGNTLLMDVENFDYWFTPMYFLSGFNWRRQREPDSEQISYIPAIVKPIPETANKPASAPVQMSLFELDA